MHLLRLMISVLLLMVCGYSQVTLTEEQAEKAKKIILIYPILQSNYNYSQVIISNQNRELLNYYQAVQELQLSLQIETAKIDVEKKKKKNAIIFSVGATGFIVLENTLLGLILWTQTR